MLVSRLLVGGLQCKQLQRNALFVVVLKYIEWRTTDHEVFLFYFQLFVADKL
jgi:hypothetical protein